jgi:hypothetical protein
VPPLELAKRAALHLRTVALGVEDGDDALKAAGVGFFFSAA